MIMSDLQITWFSRAYNRNREVLCLIPWLYPSLRSYVKPGTLTERRGRCGVRMEAKDAEPDMLTLSYRIMLMLCYFWLLFMRVVGKLF